MRSPGALDSRNQAFPEKQGRICWLSPPFISNLGMAQAACEVGLTGRKGRNQTVPLEAVAQIRKRDKVEQLVIGLQCLDELHRALQVHIAIREAMDQQQSCLNLARLLNQVPGGVALRVRLRGSHRRRYRLAFSGHREGKLP